MVYITSAYAYVDIAEPWSCRIVYEDLPVTPEQAHALLGEGTLVSVGATKHEYPHLGPGQVWGPREVGWLVTVVAFVAEEADDALGRALEGLRRDIYAGWVEPGTHVDLARASLEPREEFLQAYRRRVLEDLIRGVR